MHTRASADAVSKAYIFAVAILWLPTGFLVDFLYRKYGLKKRSHS
jgi:hypothetical protein